MPQTNRNGFRRIERMKKILMLAAVLVGTAAASQAGIDLRIGIPLPPLPRVIFGYPAPVVVAPQHCAPVYGYGYGYGYGYHAYGHGYGRHGNHRDNGYSHGYRSYDRDYSRGRDSSHGGRHGRR